MNIFKQKKYKKSAQQLVEFLLVAPFIVIFLGIVTEFTYALNTNYVLYHGLKVVTSSLYSKIKPNMNDDDITSVAYAQLSAFLNSNNLPSVGSNMSLNFTRSDKNAIFIATYKYRPVFTLPNVYFSIMPKNFNFSSTVVVPDAFLKANAYDDIISTQLDGIWGANAGIGSLDAFNDAKRGILKDGVGLGSMAFLIPTETEGFESQIVYALVDSGGGIMNDPDDPDLFLPPPDNKSNSLYSSPADGQVYKCKLQDFVDEEGEEYSKEVCEPFKGNSVAYLSTERGKTNIIFYNDIGSTDWGYISTNWRGGGCTVLADAGCQGILKNAITLNNGLNVGNYDNIDVSTYNSAVSPTLRYKAYLRGSAVYVKPE